MGCHTWFYDKISTPSPSEIRGLVVAKIDWEIEFLERLIEDRDSFEPELLAAFPEWTSEYAKEKTPEWFILRESVSNKTMPEEVLYEYYAEWSDEHIVWVEDLGWFQEVDDYHDLFRQYDYSSVRLYSLPETLEYIKNPDNRCLVFDTTHNYLKEFWDAHPNGMIQFG